MKYIVLVDGVESTVTAKNIHDVLDKCEKKDEAVDKITDEEGNVLAQRLEVSDNTQTEIKGD